MRQEKCRYSEEKALSDFFLCCMHRWPSEMRYTYLHFQKHVEWWPLEGTWAQSYKMMRQVNTVQWFRSLLFRLLLWCLEGEPNMYPQLLFKLDHVTQSCACSRCRSWKSSSATLVQTRPRQQVRSAISRIWYPQLLISWNTHLVLLAKFDIRNC